MSIRPHTKKVQQLDLPWVRNFDTIEELRTALIEFACHYNQTWLVARHGYRTPAQVRADQSRLNKTAETNQSIFGRLNKNSRVSREGRTVAERKTMIDRSDDLPVSRQTKALGISRGSVYYLPRPVSAENLSVMRRIDKLHLEFPFAAAGCCRAF